MPRSPGPTRARPKARPRAWVYWILMRSLPSGAPAAPPAPEARSAEPRNHLLTEAAHRLDDGCVRHVAVAHLTEHVLDAGIPERREPLGHALRRAAEGRALERVAHARLVGHLGIVPRVHTGHLHAIVGRIVGRAGVHHVPARLEERGP